MAATLARDGGDRLEGLCEGALEGVRRSECRIRLGRGGQGIERLEARLAGQAFSPHRHDTYAIGITLTGVQTFFYRGERRHCLPGQYHVLHPDEVHDGAAGTATGFGYRIAYIDPLLVQQALGGRPLPFVSDPVIDRDGVDGDLPSDLWRLEEPIGEIEQVEIIAAVADLLGRLAIGGAQKKRPLALAPLLRVRDVIAADPTSPHAVATFERLSGLDRWDLARQFRAAFGTSPSGFRTMRQLDHVRRLIRAGASLAEAALQAGFSDQSHMSRMFKRTYGLTPARWAAALA